MTAEARPSRLGRGLSALIGEIAPEMRGEAGTRTLSLAIDLLEPNPRQPRRRFAEAELEELSASVRERGVLQPILVRPHPERPGTYQIVAGERRWRAAQKAGLHEVPAILREASERECLEIAIVENVQRRDLSPIEEAEGYERLKSEFGYGQEEIARLVAKSRSHVANMLRLLTLPRPVRAMLDDGRLSAGQARPLVGHADAEALAGAILEKGLSARAAEDLARQGPPRARSSGSRKEAGAKDADTRALERQLTEALGLAVTINPEGEAGTLAIRYLRLEQLDEICRRLAAGSAV